MIKPQMIVAVIIHALIALSFVGDPDYSFLFYLVGVIVLSNIIGIFLIISDNKILGAKIFMISSAILVPIGLIGVFGARKIIDEEKKKDFYKE
jgi:uncharacterized membrane protein HdeD (DUF308 family)